MFGTIASRFNDDGVTALYQYLRGAGSASSREARCRSTRDVSTGSTRRSFPPARERYLAEISDDGPRLPRRAAEQPRLARARSSSTPARWLAADE